MTNEEKLKKFDKVANVIDPENELRDSGISRMWYRTKNCIVRSLHQSDAIDIRKEQARNWIICRSEWFSVGSGHDKLYRFILDPIGGDDEDKLDFHVDHEVDGLVTCIETILEIEKIYKPDAVKEIT